MEIFPMWIKIKHKNLYSEDAWKEINENIEDKEHY